MRRWFDAIKTRPAVQKAMEAGKAMVRSPGQMTEEQRKMMFGQSGKSVKAAAENKA